MKIALEDLETETKEDGERESEENLAGAAVKSLEEEEEGETVAERINMGKLQLRSFRERERVEAGKVKKQKNGRKRVWLSLKVGEEIGCECGAIGNVLFIAQHE